MYGLPQPVCPHDGGECDLIQPDDRAPLRVLLVCRKCHAWHVMGGTRKPGASIEWAAIGRHFTREPLATAV